MKINFIGIKDFVLKRKLKTAFSELLQDLGIDKKKVTVNLGYVSQSAIQKLNGEHRGVDKVTDVLSFPMLDLELGKWLTEEIYQKEKHPKTNLVELGDIVICEAVAAAQAQKYGHSFLREVCFLSLHGFLHILGFDHQTKEDEQQMNTLCEKVLEKIGVKR